MGSRFEYDDNRSLRRQSGSSTLSWGPRVDYRYGDIGGFYPGACRMRGEGAPLGSVVVSQGGSMAPSAGSGSGMGMGMGMGARQMVDRERPL